MRDTYFLAAKRAVLEKTTLLPWLVIALLFTVTGTFRTYELFAAPSRFVFWLAVAGIPILVGVCTRVAIQHLRPETSYLGAASAAVVVTGVVLAPALPAGVEWALGPTGIAMPSPGEVFVVIVLLGWMISLFHYFAILLAPARADGAMPRLQARLPEDLRGRLLRMSVSDHYVEVVTDRGSTRLLMRLSDAISETGAEDGLRVHRSHWVARTAVQCTVRENGRTFLVLRDGSRVPVSRGYLDAIEGLGRD